MKKQVKNIKVSTIAGLFAVTMFAMSCNPKPAGARKMVTFSYTSDGQHGAAIEQQVTDFLQKHTDITILSANGSYVHDVFNGERTDLKWERYYLIYQENK